MVNMYLPFADHLLAELQQRLLQGNERYAIQYLLPDRVQDLNDQRTNAIFSAAQADLEVNMENFIENVSVGNSAVNRHRVHLRLLWKPRCSIYRKTCIRMLLGASTFYLRCQYQLPQQNARSVP